jgi:hypothetical protein
VQERKLRKPRKGQPPAEELARGDDATLGVAAPQEDHAMKSKVESPFTAAPLLVSPPRPGADGAQRHPRSTATTNSSR